jgi:ribosomal protein S18 acetylase RimI-like enzyme
MAKIILTERPPSVEEYISLRKAVGWDIPAPDTVKVALENTMFSVCALFDDIVVGMGRVVGDGGLYFYIQDILVVPALQQQGIGELIMDSLMNYLRDRVSPEAYIGMMAASGTTGFYERFGFKKRPEDCAGMVFRKEQDPS